MNTKEIYDNLNAHKEHYRVLPAAARNAVYAVIDALKSELEKPVDVERGKKKTAKKSKRPKR